MNYLVFQIFGCWLSIFILLVVILFRLKTYLSLMSRIVSAFEEYADTVSVLRYVDKYLLNHEKNS